MTTATGENGTESGETTTSPMNAVSTTLTPEPASSGISVANSGLLCLLLGYFFVLWLIEGIEQDI